MKKIFSLLVAAVMSVGMFADVTDVLTAADLAATSNQYTDFSGVKKNTAVYAGQSATSNDAIQLRSKNSNSGIVTTTSGGTLKSISVVFNSETADTRMLDVYVSNTAFTSAADLYATGDGQVGEKVASLTKEQTSFDFTTLTTEYQYIGIRSNNGALYLNSVSITWADGNAQGGEEGDGVALYLRPGDLWKQEGSAFQYAVYYWRSDNDATSFEDGWSDIMTYMSEITYDNIFTTTIPAGFSNVIFVTLSPTAAEPAWGENAVYQTEDLTYDGKNNLFTVVNKMTDMSGATKYSGVWSTLDFTPCQPTFGIWVYEEYVPGVYNEELGQWEILNIEMDETDIFNVYNGCEQQAFQVSIEGGADLVEQDGDDIMVVENGIYNFYLKTNYGNDKLYITKQEEHFATCEEVNFGEAGVTVVMGAFDVIYVKGNNTYIKDATGTTLIYANNYGLTAGQHVEAGLEANVVDYNGLRELKPVTTADLLTITEGEAPAFADAVRYPVERQMNEVMMFRGVTGLTVSANNSRTFLGTFMEQELTFYNNWKEDFSSLDANSTYDILGCVAIYNGAIQVYMAEVTEVTSACVDNYGLIEATGRYIEGTFNSELNQWEILNLDCLKDSYFQAFSRCANETLNVVIKQGNEYFELQENGMMRVKEDGKYNFYLKLNYSNDELYIVRLEEPVDDYATTVDINTAENGTELTLGGFTVVYVNGSYIYIQDAAGMSLIYIRNYGLQAGDIVAAGMQGTVSIYNTLPEFVPTTAYEDLVITQGTVPAIAEATAVPTMADINRMFIYKGIIFGDVTGSNVLTINATFKGEDIVFYDRFNVYKEMFAQQEAPARVAADEKTYTITGCVASYKGNMQVYITAIVEEQTTPTALSETMQDAGVRKVMIDGQMYIIRDGVIYNAQGAVVH